jgi:hypothetical protein
VSTGGLFAIGVLVTLIVAVGIALPIYGAILDGRYEAEHRLAEVKKLDQRGSSRPEAA